jgi:replicative DNA helicase
MLTLTDQAERALLGALLSDQPVPAELGYLRADDFAHRVHGQLFDLITGLRQDHPNLAGDHLITAVVRAATRGVDTAWLADVRDACPEPAHVAAYARMVQTAGFRRDIAGHAERIATAAAHTTDVDGHAHLTKLADALARQAEVYAAFHTLELTSPDHTPGLFNGDAARITREEELLADLLQHPEQAADIAVFVHASTFTSRQRREVFETLVRLGYDGEAVDEITVGWELANIRAITPPNLDPLDRLDTGEPDITLLHRLATTRTTRSAIETGRDLIADDMRTTLAHRLGTLDRNRPKPTIAPEQNRPTSSPGVDPNLRPAQPPINGHPSPRIDR